MRFSKTVAFDNLTLTLESVVSESLQKSRVNEKLKKEIHRRNEEGGLKLDLLMAGDHSLFEAFWEIQGASRDHAYFAVQVYLEAVFDQIETIYSKQIFFGKHKMKLNLAGVLVIAEERDCPLKMSAYLNGGNETFSEGTKMTWSLDALKAIAALSSWRALHTDVLPKHDHIVFITKFDLLSPTGASATQGMGFVQKMCDSHESVSVVEDIGALTTSTIAAHEIGHNLGAFHDGETNDTCNPRSNYLMAPSASSSTSGFIFENGFRFSNCSLQSIEAFMETVESACLTARENPKKVKQALSRSSLSSKRKLRPGEQFGATRQCQIAFAPHYGECNQRQYKDLNPDPCRRLWCKNRLESRFAPCETKSYLPLMDGTECGKGKWCQSGNCIVNEFFDPESECQDLNEAYCREKYPPAIMKVFCIRKSFSSICCRQCKKYNYYIYEKYRKAEKQFKKKKIPPRILKFDIIEELNFNETDIDPL
ncbi:hypothetical protein FO519_009400 [Halicephalobus sp. NKZ332]|nr:hypothetical protein FO519_009400 [Halicephalobus sp. NKZ332]